MLKKKCSTTQKIKKKRKEKKKERTEQFRDGHERNGSGGGGGKGGVISIPCLPSASCWRRAFSSSAVRLAHLSSSRTWLRLLIIMSWLFSPTNNSSPSYQRTETKKASKLSRRLGVVVVALAAAAALTSCSTFFLPQNQHPTTHPR